MKTQDIKTKLLEKKIEKLIDIIDELDNYSEESQDRLLINRLRSEISDIDNNLSALKSAKEEVKSADQELPLNMTIYNKARAVEYDHFCEWFNPIRDRLLKYLSQFQSVQSKENPFFKDLMSKQKEIPPEIQKIVNENFMDLIDTEKRDVHTTSDHPVQSVKGEGEIRKEIEDLMIIVWHGGQKSEHEGGESFEDSLKKDGSPIQPFDMTVKDVIDTIIQMIGDKHSESKEQWISVKDRLPEKMERVLCYNGFRVIEQSWCSYTNHDIDWFKKEFTHWMPLPEPPKSK